MLNGGNDTRGDVPPPFIHTLADPTPQKHSSQESGPAPALITTISLVVCTWLAAAALPILLMLLVGPPSYSGVMGYACVMIGLQLGLAGFLGFTGARARSWWITVNGTIPLAVAPWAAPIIDDVWTARASLLNAVSEPDRLNPMGLCFLLTLAAAAFAHWKKAMSLQPARGPRCVKCDYNLTGNTSGRCPECGKPLVDDKILV